MKSLTVPRLKPRNPVALPARQRTGGAHGRRADHRRRQESRRLRDALTRAEPVLRAHEKKHG